MRILHIETTYVCFNVKMGRRKRGSIGRTVVACSIKSIRVNTLTLVSIMCHVTITRTTQDFDVRFLSPSFYIYSLLTLYIDHKVCGSHIINYIGDSLETHTMYQAMDGEEDELVAATNTTLTLLFSLILSRI